MLHEQQKHCNLCPLKLYTRFTQSNESNESFTTQLTSLNRNTQPSPQKTKEPMYPSPSIKHARPKCKADPTLRLFHPRLRSRLFTRNSSYSINHSGAESNVTANTRTAKCLQSQFPKGSFFKLWAPRTHEFTGQVIFPIGITFYSVFNG